MLTIISYIIKILFSVTITYFLVHFANDNLNKNQIFILRYSFFSTFILCPVYTISINQDNFLLLCFIIIILFTYLIFEKIENKHYFFISLIISILIAAGYIFYTILCVSAYILLINNLDILIDINNTNDDENEKLK